MKLYHRIMKGYHTLQLEGCLDEGLIRKISKKINRHQNYIN